MTGYIFFVCMMYMSPWFALIGIAHPDLKRAIGEVDLPGIRESDSLADIAQPDRLDVFQVGEIGQSPSRTKRLRYDGFHLAASGNVLECGIQGGHQPKRPAVGLWRDPMALAHGNNNQDGFSEPISDNPFTLAHGSDNFYSIGLSTPNQLHDDHSRTFEHLEDLESISSSSVDIGYDDHQSTAKVADTGGELRPTLNQEQHQLYSRDPNPNGLWESQPLELSGSNWGAQDVLNFENGKTSQQEKFNNFLNDPIRVSSRPSSDLENYALTNPTQVKGQFTYNNHQSDSFQDFKSLAPSYRIFKSIHEGRKEMLAQQIGLSVAGSGLPLLDVELQKLEIVAVRCPPAGSISASALEKYILPFKVTIDLLLGNFRKRSFNAYNEFKDISAVEVSYNSLPSPVIRVLGRVRGILGPSHLQNLFGQLLRWVLFNHEAFLNTMSIPQEERPDFHEQLLYWFEVEMFRPNGSLPVVGPINRKPLMYNRNDFGPVQRKVIDYLSGQDAGKSSCQVSATIIGIWYRNFYLKEWWDGPAGGDASFSKSMSYSIQLARINHITVQHPSELSKNESEELLGNFKIFPIQNASYLSPKEFDRFNLLPTKLRTTSPLCVMVIINEIEMIYGQHEITLGFRCNSFSNIPVVLVRHYKNLNRQLKVIRILDPLDKIITPDILIRKMHCFLEKLLIYHTILAESYEYQRIKGIPGTADQLFEWVKNKCFNFDDGLPIFGVLPNDRVFKDGNPFGEVQIYLISILSRETKGSLSDKAALAILGYWCKNKLAEFWKENWDSDKEFWAFMDTELKMYTKVEINEYNYVTQNPLKQI